MFYNVYNDVGTTTLVDAYPDYNLDHFQASSPRRTMLCGYQLVLMYVNCVNMSTMLHRE